MSDSDVTAAGVGFIGLGAMGAPMAHRVLGAGYPLSVYDVLPEPVEKLVAAGAVGAVGPAEVAQRSDIVVTMLPNSPDVQAAVTGPNGVLAGLRPGAVLVEMSTISPAVTRVVHEAVTAAGGLMVDAPVGRTSRQAEEGDLLVMVGGDPEVVERVRPVLRCFGTDIVHCGPAVGAGETMKLVNNLLTTIIIAADAEALVLGAKAGLDLDVMLTVLRSTGASNRHLTSTYAEKALRRDFSPGFATRLAVKDLRLALGMAVDHRLPAGVGAAALQLFTMGCNQGHEDHDYTSVVTVLERLAGVELREHPMKGP